MSLQIHRQTVLKNWRMGQLSIVRKVSDNTVNVTDLDQLCLKVAEAVRERFHYYFVAIFTCEINDVLLCRSSSPTITDMDGSTQFSVQPGKGIVGWAADHKEEIYVEDTG